MAQGEQVVGQVHAVVVLDGRQMRELQQVLSEHGTTQNPSGGRVQWEVSVERSAGWRPKHPVQASPAPPVL